MTIFKRFVDKRCTTSMLALAVGMKNMRVNRHSHELLFRRRQWATTANIHRQSTADIIVSLPCRMPEMTDDILVIY